MSKSRLEKLLSLIEFQRKNGSHYGEPACSITLLYDDINWFVRNVEKADELRNEIKLVLSEMCSLERNSNENLVVAYKMLSEILEEEKSE